MDITEEQKQELYNYCRVYIRENEDVDTAFERVMAKLEGDDTAPDDPEEFMKYAKMTARAECLNLVREIVQGIAGKEDSDVMKEFVPGINEMINEATRNTAAKDEDEEKSEQEENHKHAIIFGFCIAALFAVTIALDIVVKKRKKK